jgi:hypothetical protein
MAERFEGAVKPSSIEKDGYESDLYAHRSVEIPSNMGMRVSYDASNRPQYVGYAPRALAEGTAGWLLQKFDYDGTTTRCTSRTIAYGNWTGRATASYA